jgi:hypothetical protein
MDLIAEIRRARQQLPWTHRALLEQLGVQEIAVEDWPQGVLNLYLTLNKQPPQRSQVEQAAAVWLQEQRTVAFNAPFLEAAVVGLDELGLEIAIHPLAWHEYGHALSLMRSTPELRARGAMLLALLPPRLQEVVRPEGYRQSALFDEVVATIYALMIGRIRDNGYVVPEFLHPAVFAAFQEVIPWPPTH